MESTCTTANCSEPVRARGLCQRHYVAYWEANKRHVCTVEGCEKRTNRLDYCAMHLARLRKHGDVNYQRFDRERPSYQAMHARVKKARGKAHEHACVGCGQPADHWSWNHQAPAGTVLTYEIADPRSHGKRTVTYSNDVNDYEPRCASCHTSFDSGRDDATGQFVGRSSP